MNISDKGIEVIGMSILGVGALSFVLTVLHLIELLGKHAQGLSL